MGLPEIARRSPRLVAEGFAHGFFGRRGGTSPPPFDSLDCATHPGVDADTVRANLALVAGALGVEPSRLHVVSQVHGRAVREVGPGDAQGDVARTEADALVTRAPGVALGVRTADCVPVLVADLRSGAVAAIHSGWQGTEVDVVGAAVRALVARLDAAPTLVAAIGPHLEACCFEVGDDVAARLDACAPEALAVVRAGSARPHVDLRRIVRWQLIASGLPDAAIDDVRGCTRCEAAAFFSFRRDRERSGRQVAAIVGRQVADPTPTQWKP